MIQCGVKFMHCICSKFGRQNEFPLIQASPSMEKIIKEENKCKKKWGNDIINGSDIVIHKFLNHGI